MMTLPSLGVEAIPNVRRARSDTELRQFLLADAENFAHLSGVWVRKTTPMVLDEVLDAGQPKFYTVEINGTTGDTGNQRRGFTPGAINQARTAARVLFLGKELQGVANSLRPILSSVIRATFPNSRLQRLARDWVWYIARDGLLDGQRSAVEYMGGSVSGAVSVYDVLWLVPEAIDPARYAWFANRLAKRGYGAKYNTIKDRRGRTHPRAVARGFLAESTRRMRGRRVPGVVITGTFVRSGLTAAASRTAKGVPAIRVAFRAGLLRPVSNS